MENFNIETVKTAFEAVMFWFGTIVAAASIIVKATPTQKDDAVLAKVVKILDLLSVFNTKENQAKIQFVDDHTFSAEDCPVIIGEKKDKQND